MWEAESPLCPCQQSEEDAYHYFFVCKSYEEFRPEVQTMNINNEKDCNSLRNFIKRTQKLACKERNRILKPNKTRIVEKGVSNERIHEYRPSQEGRKQIEM